MPAQNRNYTSNLILFNNLAGIVEKMRCCKINMWHQLQTRQSYQAEINLSNGNMAANLSFWKEITVCVLTCFFANIICQLVIDFLNFLLARSEDNLQ